MRANAVQFTAESPHSVQDVALALGAEIKGRPLRVVCVGAHPDDAETGCGGTLSRLVAEGHQVTIVYLTRGEAGIKGELASQAGQIRTGESIEACRRLGIDYRFAGQIDGETYFDTAATREFSNTLLALQADIVFTHWPFDTHADHRTAAQLTYEAWQLSGESFLLVYYEVMSGIQTHHFQPNCWIDISSVVERKQQAIYAHVSQRPDRFYPYHVAMERQRGKEADCERAEAFVVMSERSPRPLIPFTM